MQLGRRLVTSAASAELCFLFARCALPAQYDAVTVTGCCAGCEPGNSGFSLNQPWLAQYGRAVHMEVAQTVFQRTVHAGAMFNPVDRRAYLPLPCPSLPLGSVYIAVEYEVCCGAYSIAHWQHGCSAANMPHCSGMVWHGPAEHVHVA